MSDEGSKRPKPLDIKCTDSACGDNLHCFKQARGSKAMPAFDKGLCRTCGADLIDWPRVHQRDLSDVDHTFHQLHHELIRHHFWHLEIDDGAIDHARRLGRTQLHNAAYHRIVTSVGKGRDENAWDGQQTKKSGNSLYYAQHATASCCRTCIEYWHGIHPDGLLTPDEVDYLTGLVIRYVDERLPQLNDEPEYVPRRSRK